MRSFRGGDPFASRVIADAVRALVLVGPKHLAGRRVDQVYPCAGGAGHSFKMLGAALSRVIRDPADCDGSGLSNAQIGTAEAGPAEGGWNRFGQGRSALRLVRASEQADASRSRAGPFDMDQRQISVANCS